MRKLASILLGAALLAPVGLVAQGQPGGGPGGRGIMMRSPIAIAIAHKADLALTDDQAAKLDVIDKALTAKNAPLRQKMQEARNGVDFQSMTDEQRQAMREKVMPIMTEMRANPASARAEAEKLLKPEQVTKLQAILQQEMPQRGPRPNN